MKNFDLGYIVESDNVYRTKNYIVRQMLSVATANKDVAGIMSFDTFIKRNRYRDKQYEYFYKDRRSLNGRRIHCNLYARSYIY